MPHLQCVGESMNNVVSFNTNASSIDMDDASIQPYQTIVFNAARDNNLKRLRVFLERRTKSQVESLVNMRTFNTPPAVIASRNGHHEVLQYLVSADSQSSTPCAVVLWREDVIDGGS